MIYIFKDNVNVYVVVKAKDYKEARASVEADRERFKTRNGESQNEEVYVKNLGYSLFKKLSLLLKVEVTKTNLKSILDTLAYELQNKTQTNQNSNYPFKHTAKEYQNDNFLSNYDTFCNYQ